MTKDLENMLRTILYNQSVIMYALAPKDEKGIIKSTGIARRAEYTENLITGVVPNRESK